MYNMQAFYKFGLATQSFRLPSKEFFKLCLPASAVSELFL
jgi:hypothetical protein